MVVGVSVLNVSACVREKKHVLDTGEVLDVFLVVSIVGSHSVVRMTGNTTKIFIPQHPTGFVMTTNLVSGTGNDDQGAIERHEKFAHGGGMKTEKSIDCLHLRVVTIGLIKGWL